MRKSLIAILALLLPLFANAQDVAVNDSVQATAEVPEVQDTIARTVRFGYISYSAALKAMPEYAVAMIDLDSLKAVYDKEVESSEAELNKRFAEYIDGQATFPENILLKRQKEIQMLVNQSIEFKQEAQQLLTNAEKALLQPLHDRLNAALAKVGADCNYAFILNTDNNACPFINAAQGEDVTDVVMTILGTKE